ncbi:homocysteine S-methyltransferase family protein [Aliishimia ponticola]|uniref:Homocysteine S-methyltransferase family protein n=1 Tax=Aliishimia ponticola TaxID=2499833 RepID=A0A4S4NKI2_9RHOB|nr:homocysteine S-methyltransferase family protein [Aliishimia ponticola]THH36650.1 homocysteine S-methyltransferase family protein [Aliishimia ponticola]
MTDITLLDGGMGQELIRRAGGVATPLWATQSLLDAPESVTAVHTDYADAGATVATTNTYALHRDRLRGGDSNHYAAEGTALPNMEDQLGALITTALDAVEPVRNRCRVAGSIGPIGASYRADLMPDHDEAVAIYAEVAKLLAPRVDLLLFETLPSIAAGRAALAAGRQTNRPVWLCFTVDDRDGHRLRSGEPVAEAATIAQEADAVLINCSAPEAIPAALEALATSNRPLGAYANGFTEITEAFIKGNTTAKALTARSDLSAQAYADHAMGWLDHGATILGGCCEVGPAHIAELANRLRAKGHSLV